MISSLFVQPRTYGIVKFTASMKNPYRDKIITSLGISVKHKANVNSAGEPVTEVLYAKSLWIEPHETKHVEFLDLKFKPKLDNNDKHSFEWGISWVGSLNIVLR